MSNSVFFENKIAGYLNAEGIKYKTQTQIAAEQTEKYGGPVCTPDFLLTIPMTIRLEAGDVIIRHEVYWIEAKAYRLPSTGPLVDSLTAQVKKYVDMFGSGAVIFQDGMVKNIHIDSVLMLAWDDKQ